ncbi:hypothetical protein JG688_00001279 [Phytophthora aleatoria]|uniref:WW domain-containing protein n=1 Tax=Phytophthora aleatoria TaxID=2496075 RepID=A0A8J5J496_9STRA|nr:hypothetical protein JG688_00001279 [Phytophthora aleatoria]
MQDGAVLSPSMERATRSPQSRHRKRRLLEATQHVSPASDRLLVENMAAQVAATQSSVDQTEAVNACIRVLRNVKNSVHLRALAARALGLLMLESRALADRLRLETEGLVDALLQIVGYCRRSRTQTADTRRVHVNCCLVISLLMQAPSQQHLQLVVSLDSDLLEWHAALIFQRCWYKRNNEWSTFLLLGCLREKENEEREFDAQVLAYKRNHMARVIRRTWLGYLAAKRNKAAEIIQRNIRRLAAQHFVESLLRIQRKWRHNAHQRAARKLLRAQKRKQTNPFQTETSVGVIIDRMLSLSAAFYDLDDELRGMHVQEWLRRLGLAAKYGELFQKNRWVASVDQIDVLMRLRELNLDACEEKLESIGVLDNEGMQMILTNLFAYQTIQETKRQPCTDAQQKCEDALGEALQEAKEFRNPPKAVRDRQAACTRKLEDAVKKTSQAHEKCESSAALHAAYAREIATRQQQFASQQESKEISAVHSLRSLRLIDQLNVAREIFLERFPGLDARAFAFVNALEENQVTRWQLQRFFDTYTTISEVKQNMKELTFFSFETESERKKEQEALDAWLAEEAKAHRIRLLYNVIRYPYVEEWDDEAQAYVYAIYSQIDDSTAPLDEDQQPFEQVPTRYYVTEKPIYTIEEEDKAIRIQAQTRRFLAQCHLQEMQRLNRRERRRAALEAEWDNSRQERAQFLTLKFQFQFRNNSHVSTWLGARVKSKPPVHSAPTAVSPTKRGNGTKKSTGAKSATKTAGRSQKEDSSKINEATGGQEQRRVRVHATLNAAVDALAPTYHASVRAEHRRNWSFSANSRPGNAYGRAIVRLLEELPTLYRQTAPESLATCRLRYTKMALRFGWEEVLSNAALGVNMSNAPPSYFFNENTLETSWERPDYSFDEQIAAIRIQALARMFFAFNAREKELTAISFVTTVQDTIKQAARVGWVGYSLEGMTSAVFLSRFGLTKYVTSALGQSPLKELLTAVSSEEKAKSLDWSKEEVGLRFECFVYVVGISLPKKLVQEQQLPSSVPGDRWVLGNFYFVYTPTDEKLLEEPRDEITGGILPFRPMIQDRLTKSVRWMGNPGCFERFHTKGKRSDHTFTMVEVPTEMPQEILALEEQVRAKRRRDAEMAEHEAKRLAAALLEEEGAAAMKKVTKTRQKKTKKKKRSPVDAPDGKKICAVPLCRHRALVLDVPGVSFCPEHFTLQHALEVAGKDPLEAARLLTLVDNGGGRVVKSQKTGWRGLLPGNLFPRGHRDTKKPPKMKETSTSVQADSSTTTTS